MKLPSWRPWRNEITASHLCGVVQAWHASIPLYWGNERNKMSASASVEEPLKAPESGTPCAVPGIGAGMEQSPT